MFVVKLTSFVAGGVAELNEQMQDIVAEVKSETNTPPSA